MGGGDIPLYAFGWSGQNSNMPIYEFACPKCRRIFSFLSRRVNPSHSPVCPKCGNRNLKKEMSRFALTKGIAEPTAATGPGSGGDFSPAEEARLERVMSEMERDMPHLDENNPRHMAHLMRKMKDALPPGEVPREFDVAIRRLEAGEDPDKIEADMGDVLGMMDGGGKSGASYTQDEGLYDY